MFVLNKKNRIIIIVVVSLLILGTFEIPNLMGVSHSSESSNDFQRTFQGSIKNSIGRVNQENNPNLAIHSSDIITEDVDEFLEGTMDNLIINEDQLLSLDKESVNDFWRKMRTGTIAPTGRSMFSYAYNSQNAKTILFGGLDPYSYPAGMAQTLVYDLDAKNWIQMNPATSPSVRHRHSMAYASNSDKVILYGGYNYASILPDTWSYDYVTNNWTNMNPATNPGSRYYHSIAYNSHFDNVILFGGFSLGLPSTTWAYNLTANNWTNMNPVSKPSGRYSHSMVYAANSGKIILFGGDGQWGGYLPLNDTWIYDQTMNNWTNMNPVSRPNARFGHSMVYDAVSDKVILYGGYNGSSHFNDTWVYDLTTNNWTKMNPVSKPNARYYHGLVYTADSGKTVLFGGSDTHGYSGGMNHYSDTWTYDLTTNRWVEAFPVTPIPRHRHSMAYDVNSDQAILFGGFDAKYFDDTWMYNVTANNWTNMNPVTKPSARDGHSMVYDVGSEEVILFGGYDGSYLSDTWVYNLTPNTWTQMNPLTMPKARSGHSMVFTASSGKVILFGGYDGSSYMDDTWIYYLTTNTWTQITPTTKPPNSSRHSMVYDDNSDKVILFGGTNGTYLDSTWIFDLATNSWNQTYPANKPSARSDHSMIYNPNSNKSLLFGGNDGSYLNDTWTYDLTTNIWVQKTPLTLPNNRFCHSMVYIAGSDRVILFGGYDSKSLGDTWVYVGSTFHQSGTFSSRLSCFKDILRITGEFNWTPLTQPPGTELRVQLGLSNTTKDEDFQYSSYYTSDFTFYGSGLYLKYRVVFESDINQSYSPVLRRVNIYYSSDVPSVPSAPQSLSATSGPGFVELSWSPPIKDGGYAIVRYHIYRGTTPGNTSGQYMFLGISTSTKFNDTTVIGGTNYYYVVTAINAIGESNLSNEVSALPTSASTSEPITQISSTTTQTTIESQSTMSPGVLTVLVILCTFVVFTRKVNRRV